MATIWVEPTTTTVNIDVDWEVDDQWHPVSESEAGQTGLVAYKITSYGELSFITNNHGTFVFSTGEDSPVARTDVRQGGLHDLNFDSSATIRKVSREYE